MGRIYLSPPHMSGKELELVKDAFESNWIAPLGPHVTAFEEEMCAYTGAQHAVALSSGTAALHLALQILGVEANDPVICSTLTFAASANAIRYLGAEPVFIDSEPNTWNMDPRLLEQAIDELTKNGTKPKAVVVVDIYGQCADYDAILEICNHHQIPVVEDAAEALGATYKGKHAGTFGDAATFSFNGNKIITTSGGGMLVTPREEIAQRALHLATQAREPAPHYEHNEIGYNYRLSNLLAAVGRGQLEALPDRVETRRRIFETYRRELGGMPGVEFMPEPDGCVSTRWLTALTINATVHGVTSDRIRLHLEEHDIEARPVWKPMHLQTVFSGCRSFGGGFSEHLFSNGLCLPSGSALTSDDLDRVVKAFRSAF